MRFEMNKAAAQMKEADAAIAAQKAELDKLNQIITEADQARTLLSFPVCQMVFRNPMLQPPILLLSMHCGMHTKCACM